MMKRTRLERILDLLQEEKSVEVGRLCSLLGVTEMTIRRDLDELAEKSLLLRTHGGAVSAESNILVEKPFDMRLINNFEQKDAIAGAALPLMHDGDKVFMNSSSTIFCMAKRVGNVRRCLVVTEATNIANELNTHRNISVIQIGGELRKNTISCVGYFAEEMIRQFRFDAAFIGINAVDGAGALYCASTYEIGIYKAILATAKRIIVLADSSKLGRSDFAQVGSASDISCLITDSGIPPDLLARYREAGIDVLVAANPEAEETPDQEA